MREIKFRAWNQDSQEFQYFVFGENGHFTYTFDAHSQNAIRELQQYTGLKDKSGVEIYEGDILKTTVGNHEWHYLVRRYTEFDCNLYGDTIYRNFESSDGLYEYGDFYTSEPTRKSLHGAYHSLEVIGNIYENPELLETTNTERTE